MSQTSFVDAFLPKGFGRNERLEKISGLLDWRPLERLVLKVRSGEHGRPPYTALSMFKALLLQQWYGLSDPALEEALLDRVSFRRFCGFALDADSPDETTLCRFRNALKEAKLGDKLFAEINRQLDARGLVVRQGTLVDATLIASALRPPPSGSTPKSTPEAKGIESSNPLDPDANWTRSGAARKLFFGYKAHIGIDQGSGIIRSRQLTGAKTNETVCADALIMGDERAVYADKAYDTKARRTAIKARHAKDRIQHRRNKHQAKLPHWQTIRNILIGRVRGAIERVFSQFKGPYDLRRMRYRGEKANAFHLDLTCIAYNINRLYKLV
jgi:transposase, IS5 family